MHAAIRPKFLALVTATLLVVASCGTSIPEKSVAELKSDTTEATATTASEPEPDPGASTSTSTSAPATTEPKTQPKASGGKFCDEIGKFAALAEDSEDEFDMDLDFGDSEIPPAQLEAMKKSFVEIDKSLTNAVAAAPPEIKSEMETLSDFYSQFSDIVASAESTDDLFGGLMALAFSGLDQEELDAAGEKVDAYVERECGLDLDVG